MNGISKRLSVAALIAFLPGLYYCEALISKINFQSNKIVSNGNGYTLAYNGISVKSIPYFIVLAIISAALISIVLSLIKPKFFLPAAIILIAAELASMLFINTNFEEFMVFRYFFGINLFSFFNIRDNGIYIIVKFIFPFASLALLVSALINRIFNTNYSSELNQKI